MKEKLNSILEAYAEKLEKYEAKEEKLNFKIEYCGQHNLNEEKRIALVEFNSMDRILWNFRKMFNEIKEVSDKWDA